VPAVGERTQGTSLGFQIETSLALRTLRNVGNDRFPSLRVQDDLVDEPTGELIRTWAQRPGNPFSGRLLRDRTNFGFWASDAGWFLVDPEGRHIRLERTEVSLPRELRLFGVPAALCAFAQGDVTIHASAVEINGRAILLAGPSHIGKTTLAASLAGSGHRLLAEDSTRCSTNVRADQVVCYPGPGALRLRADVAAWLRVPGTSPVRMEDGRTCLLLDEVARGDGAAVPIQAVLIPSVGEGQPHLEPVARTEAVRDLLALTFQLPEQGSMAEAFGRIADLVGRISVFRLVRPMDSAGAADVVALVERFIRESAND
jgi:hypothetical protein